MRFAAQGNISTTGRESPVREAERLNRIMGTDVLRLIDLDATTTREAVTDNAVNQELRDMQPAQLILAHHRAHALLPLMRAEPKIYFAHTPTSLPGVPSIPVIIVRLIALPSPLSPSFQSLLFIPSIRRDSC